MPRHPTHRSLPVFALALTLAALPFTALPTPAPAETARAETAIVPEKNPPGDIPDTQAFVDYLATGDYTLKVPEGWARSDVAGGVSFVAKLDGVTVTLTATASAPSIASVKASYLPAMVAAGRAVEVSSVKSVDLPGGPAIRIDYSANSEPNAVTNKQIRLEANRYLFFKSGKVAALDLYAPFGADNVDQWNLMSQSFQWK